MKYTDAMHKGFQRDLIASEGAVEFLARRFERMGLVVERRPLVVAATPAERVECRDCGDLIVSGARIEVKEVTYAFTACADHPYRCYDDLLVCQCNKWDQAEPKPYAVYILSADRRAGIRIGGESHPHWTVRRKWARNDGRYDNYYFVRWEHVAFFPL